MRIDANRKRRLWRKKMKPKHIPIAISVVIISVLVLTFKAYSSLWNDLDGSEKSSSSVEERRFSDSVITQNVEERERMKAGNDDDHEKNEEKKIASGAGSKNYRVGDATEVCSSWTADARVKQTVRKSYWIRSQGELTSHELLRKSQCQNGGQSRNCWERKLSADDDDRVRNVGSASMARLKNGSVISVFRASYDVVGEDGQHLRTSLSKTGEGKGWKNALVFEEVSKFHGNDWKRQRGPAIWDPLIFVESVGKARAFVFYTVSSNNSNNNKCRHEKAVPLLGFSNRNKIKPWVRGGDLFVIASKDETLTEWEEPKILMKSSSDFLNAPITINGPVVEMDDVNTKTGNRDWVLPVCVNGMKQIVDSKGENFISAYTRIVYRDGLTGEGGFNPKKCGIQQMRKCGVIISEDLGKSWDTTRLHEKLGFDAKKEIMLGDLSVAEIGNGGLYAIFRPKIFPTTQTSASLRAQKTARIYTAISTDLGKTWTTPREMSPEMRTFDSAARLFRLQPKGPLVLAFNDRSASVASIIINNDENDDENDINNNNRNSGNSSANDDDDDDATAKNLGALRLTLATSHDHGRSWQKVVTFRDGADTHNVRKTLGLRVRDPWLLQHGCKAFVAYSRDYHALEYSSKFARAQLENDRELGIRVSHVDM